MNWSEKIKYWIHCIRDYDRLAYDYCLILDHTTRGKMSKPNYVINVVKAVIDDTQDEFYESMHYDDLSQILTDPESLQAIDEYFSKRKGA